MGSIDINELTNGTFKESHTFRLFPVSRPPEACSLIKTKKELRIFKSKHGWVLSTAAKDMARTTPEGKQFVGSDLQIDYLVSIPKFLNGSWQRVSLCSVEEIGPEHVKLRWTGENAEQFSHVSKSPKVVSQAWTSLITPFSNHQYSVRDSDINTYKSQLDAMRSFYGVTLPADYNDYLRNNLAGNVQMVIQSGKTVRLEDLRRFGLYPEHIKKGQADPPCRAAASFKLSHTVEQLVHYSAVNETLLNEIPFERLPEQSDADFEAWKQEWLTEELANLENTDPSKQSLVAVVKLHVKPIPLDLIRRRLARQDEGVKA